MKILLINKFHYMRGGSETYYFAQAEALKAKGHEVCFFAMQDKKNLPCEQEKYFVPNVDYNSRGGLKKKVLAAKDILYSKIAAEKMEELIMAEKPDVAHIGLIHRQITFSVVEVLKKHNIPVVMTMHDLIFACPNYTMLTSGMVCEQCVEGSVFNCIKKKCIKDSLSKSIIGAVEKRYLLNKKFYNMIDLYITECNWYRELMVRSDVTTSKIITMTNFLPIGQKYYFETKYQDYILYFGRFSREKGIQTLLEAHKQSGCKYRMMVVGAGPCEKELHEYVTVNNLTNVEFPGAIYGDEMERIIESAKLIVVPSEWYENCPYALLQSIAKGKIVLASNIGGLPELIKDGETGFLFKPGNADDMMTKIQYVMNMDEERYSKMSNHICEEAKNNHYWEKYIDKLIVEYQRLLEA